MRWLLSAYTIRFNHRHKLFGHVFSGRYKALLVEGRGDGYLKTVCDYVHLNPARAGLLGAEDRLLGYPWSSLAWFLAAPEHRPRWMRVDRLLGEHGIAGDTAAGRAEFERRMEAWRHAERDEAEHEALRRGWCLGGEAFRQEMLGRLEGRLGEHHAGELKRESAQVRAERIIAEELGRLGWTEAQLRQRRKSDGDKLALAARLRRETTLTVGWIAQRLQMGTRKSAAMKLHRWPRIRSLFLAASCVSFVRNPPCGILVSPVSAGPFANGHVYSVRVFRPDTWTVAPLKHHHTEAHTRLPCYVGRPSPFILKKTWIANA